jgi:hypothetical protein
MTSLSSLWTPPQQQVSATSACDALAFLRQLRDQCDQVSAPDVVPADQVVPIVAAPNPKPACQPVCIDDSQVIALSRASRSRGLTGTRWTQAVASPAPKLVLTANPLRRCLAVFSVALGLRFCSGEQLLANAVPFLFPSGDPFVLLTEDDWGFIVRDSWYAFHFSNLEPTSFYEEFYVAGGPIQ